MIKKISVFIAILGLFFVGIPQFNSKAAAYEIENLEIENLASPDLTGKEYLGNGVYRLVINSTLDKTIDYNINGIFTVNAVSSVNGVSTVISNELVIGQIYTLSYIHISENIGSQVSRFNWGEGNIPFEPNKNYTVTFTATSTNLIYNLSSISNGIVNFQLQLEKGDTATPYKVPQQPLNQHIELEYYRELNSETYLIKWLFNTFYWPIQTLTDTTVNFIDNILIYSGGIQSSLSTFDINLALFSETPIIASNGYDLALLFFSVFYSLIFIVIVWKIIKKIFVKITRWNKW